MATLFNDDVDFKGSVNMISASSVLHKSGSITDSDIASHAAIGYDKLEHFELLTSDFGIATGGAPAVVERNFFEMKSAGVIRLVHASLTDTGSDTSVTIDVNKNGLTILSAPIVITDSHDDRESVAGVITASAAVAGDIFTASIEVASTIVEALGPIVTVGFSYAAPA